MCDLACNNEQLDICHAGDLPGTPMVDARKVFAMNWRFFPTLDPQVINELFLLPVGPLSSCFSCFLFLLLLPSLLLMPVPHY